MSRICWSECWALSCGASLWMPHRRSGDHLGIWMVEKNAPSRLTVGEVAESCSWPESNCELERCANRDLMQFIKKGEVLNVGRSDVTLGIRTC